MHRNIVTREDVAAVKRAAARQQHETEDRLVLGKKPTSDLSLGSLPTNIDVDCWYEKLAKYIPGEALSLYITLDSFIRSSFERPKPVPDSSTELVAWLFGALVASIIFNYLYMRRIWKVSRRSQIFISCFALVAYVVALGGAFEAADWTTPFHGGIVLILTTAFLSLVEPPGENVHIVPPVTGT